MSNLTFYGMEGSWEKSYAANDMIISFRSLHNGVRADFKALVNSFVDNFNSNWSSDQPYGKADPIRHFSNTQRTIQVSWDVVSANQEEAADNMRKISALTQMLYPVYENRGYAGTERISLLGESQAPGKAESKRRWCIAAPPLMTVKFANLISNEAPTQIQDGDNGSLLPTTPVVQQRFDGDSRLTGLICAMDTLTINPRVDAGFFEISNGVLYPKLYNVQCVVTVLHQVTPSMKANSLGVFEKTYGNLYKAGFADKDGRDRKQPGDNIDILESDDD